MGGWGIYRSRVTAALTETEKGKHAKGQSKDRSAARARERENSRIGIMKIALTLLLDPFSAQGTAPFSLRL